MLEIRWHGRGGNGAFTAAKLLGHAAGICEGKSAQAFPSFGPERRGAPVQGFTRIAEETITDHSQVYTCDCVIVLDETLCDVVPTTSGVKEDTAYVINTQKSADELRKDPRFANIKRIYTLDATQLALDMLGAPIVNTIMMGAAIGATGMVKIESAEQAIDDMMSKGLRDKNKAAVRAAYELVKGGAK